MVLQLLSLTVILGFNDANGSWNIICISSLSFFISALEYSLIFFPSNKISPSVASKSLKIVLPVVDFPQPDSPTTPKVFPSSIAKFTLSTACSCPFGV